jgi:hypothetical protein
MGHTNSNVLVGVQVQTKVTDKKQSIISKQVTCKLQP